MEGVAFGAILGPIIGVLGGASATYLSVQNTKTPAERQFMRRSAAVMWAGILLLLGLPFLLWKLGAIPGWSYWIFPALFFALLVPSVFYVNRRQAQLRGDGRS